MLEDRIFICAVIPSSTNKCGIDHEVLSLYKQLSCFPGWQSLSIRPTIFPGRVVFMLKIVFPICCGIDVHKTFIVATIASTNKSNVTTYQTKRFSTFTSDLLKLVQWLSNHQCTDICMESTGKYWVPVYNMLEPTCKIVLAHPKYVKSLRGQKTDKKDSIWIADLFKHGLVKASFIPEKRIRDLREVMRYRAKLVTMRSSEKNRYQNALTMSNVQLASVVSDTFGKSAQALIHQLLQHPEGSTFDVLPFLYGSLKKKAEQISESINGTIDAIQAQKIKACTEHIDELNTHIEDLQVAADLLAVPFASALHIIESVPGIGHLSALTILSEIGADMTAFLSAKHLCSWAGLAPCNDQSAGKKKSTRISRAGCYIKPVLVQCALAVIKDKKFTYYGQRYQALKHRRGHKKAIIAIARMLLSVIYTLLSRRELFSMEAYEASLHKPTYILSPEQQLMKLAKKFGYEVVKVPEPVT